MPNIIKPSNINAIWAESGTKVDPGASKIGLGWVVQLPPYEQANWIENRQDTFNAHVNQHGIPEWDQFTEYQGNLSYTQGSDGNIYKCLVTHTNRDPISNLNTTYWKLAFEAYGAVQVVQDQLNAHIQDYRTLANLSSATAARNNLSVYSRAESDSRFAALLGNAANPFNVAFATQDTHAVPRAQISQLVPAATEATPGVSAFASTPEVQAGTNLTKSLNPAGAAAVYLKRSDNLSNIGSPSAARTNLGLGTIATASTGDFLATANNLSDVPNKTTARSNLGLGSAAVQNEAYFLRSAQNLNDVPDKAAARSNLGLTGLATTDPNGVLFKGDNLAGLTNVANARANLGLQDSVLFNSGTWLIRNNNLGDLPNPAAARNNLQLGPLATMGLSTSTPLGSLDFTNLLQPNGWQVLPGGLIVQWGTLIGTGRTYYPNPNYIPFIRPFPNRIVYGNVSADGGFSDGYETANIDWTRTTNTTFAVYENAAGMQVKWIVIGY